MITCDSNDTHLFSLSSVVVKYTAPHADLGLRVLFRLSKLADREAGFLELNTPTAYDMPQEIPSPQLYFYGIVESTQPFIIVMEDVRSRIPDLKPGVQGKTKLVDARKIIKLQAKLHAKYMGEEEQLKAR